MDRELRLAFFAAAHFGVITRSEARSLGYSDTSIDLRIKQGLWIQIFRGIYRIASVPRCFEQDVLAAALVAKGAAARRTALRLHGIDGYQGNVVEIVTSRTRRPASGRFVFHHTDNLPPTDTAHIGPIPVTTPTRTLVELGGSLPASLVEVALDSALRQGKTSLQALHRKLEEIGGSGRNGSGVLRRLLDERPLRGVPESPLETLLRRVLVRFGVPQPVAQFVVEDREGFVARLDFAYPELKVAIECQSYQWHSGRQSWHKDIERHNRLQDLGWTIVYVTWQELCRGPKAVARRVADALCRASTGGRG